MKIKKIILLGLLLSIFAACSKTEIKKEVPFLPNLKTDLLKNKEKGKLIFTFASLAYTVDAEWGKGIPKIGMEKLAKVAHKYNIPVTWLIDLGSGTEMKSKINEWHDKNGDGIELNWESAKIKGKDDLIKVLDSLKILFPWSKVEVAASGQRSNKMLQNVKNGGLSGVWGSCWEQVGIDGITDRGAPWGYYYASDDNYKLPSLSGKGLVSIEWTSRDLLKSLHAEAPTIYSSDPNDVGRAGLCTGDDIAYWKTLFDNYIRNISINKFVFFQQHQEAHEMEYGDVCKAYTLEDIDESEKMLDAFFAYVKSYGNMVEYKTITQAVQLYKENFSETEPAIMLFDDAPARKPIFWYATRANRASGPWPKTLLYYDKKCQLAFIEDQFKPIMYRDYINNREVYDPKHYQVDSPIEIKVRPPWGKVEPTKIPIEIIADKEMPYAVTFWYDFNLYKIKSVDGAKYFGPVENQVIILRLDLKKGSNKISIQLEKI